MITTAPINYASAVMALTLILHSDALPSTTLPSSTVKQPTPEKICGTILTSTGKTVTLMEAVSLSPENFNQVRNITLKRSLFSPVPNCAIQICGFMSLGTPLQEGYIGQPFQTSALSCGCKNSTSNCIPSCDDTRTKNWNDNECAMLYEEQDCTNCYFPPITLSENETYTTNTSHHITSLVVRPQCKVLQYAPALRRFHRFTNISQPLVYEYRPKQHDNIRSAFQLEPDTFHCVCPKEETSLVVSPIPETHQKRDHPPGGMRLNAGKLDQSGKLGVGSWGTTIGGGVIVLITAAVVGIYVLRRKLNWCGNGSGSQISMEEEGGAVPEENGVPLLPPETSPCEGEQVTSMEQSRANNGNENKLEEKLDDVRKLLELLCGGGASSSNQALLQEKPLQTNGKAVEVEAVEDQLKKVCKAENILNRDRILLRKEGNCLGTGQFGTVYKAVVKSANDLDGLHEVVAVKVVEWQGCTDEHVKSFVREVKMYQDVGAGSEHIVRMVGACVHEDGLFILTQFCEGGSLKAYLVNELRPRVYVQEVSELGDGYSGTMGSKGKLVYRKDNSIERQLIRFSEQIAGGMEWLSSKGIIHGDLAVRNVLLSGIDRTAKICDLGLSRKCAGKEYVLDTLSKFPYNSLAPELCKSDERAYRLTSNVDVWAYGCTLFEIFSLGEAVYADVQEKESDKVIEVMRLLVFEKYRHPRPDTMSDELWNKLLECWAEEPEKRPSFSELRQFFEEMNKLIY